MRVGALKKDCNIKSRNSLFSKYGITLGSGKKVLRLFVKRLIKYLVIMAVFIFVIITLIFSSYNLEKEQIVDKSLRSLNDGVVGLQTQVEKAREIGSLLMIEAQYSNLLQLKGEPSPSNYVDINEIQNRLKRLCATQDFLTNAYIMFRDNKFFISNYISSDDYESVYPQFIKYENQSIDELYNILFEDVSMIKFMPSRGFSLPSYVTTPMQGVTCIINNSYYATEEKTSVLACVLDNDSIIKSMSDEDVMEQAFFYLTDSTGQIILSKDYSNNEVINMSEQRQEVEIDNKNYIVLESQTTPMGLTAVLGMSVQSFNKNVSGMISLAAFYSISGVIFVVLVSLFLAIKETISFRKIINEVSKGTETSYNSKNEYSYISNGVMYINEMNDKYVYKIDKLNNSIKTCVLENLFIMGAYSQKEQLQITNYFNNSFDFFCVTIINVTSADLTDNFESIQQGLIIEVERLFEKSIDKQYVSINASSNELSAIIFFNQDDCSDISIVKESMTEIIYDISEIIKPLPIVNIGLSKISCGIKNVREAYLQAKDAINFNMNQNSSGVYIYNTPRTTAHQKTIDIAVLTRCYDVLISGDSEAIIAIFDDILEAAQKIDIGEKEKQQLFFSIRQPIHNAYLEIKPEKDDLFNVEVPDFNSALTIEEIILEFKEFSQLLCEFVHTGKKNVNEKLKNDVIRYIDENYNDVNLSAATISTNLLISEKYVFLVVKEATGKTLSKYIGDIRIGRAEELLSTTTHSTAKISELCGFGSDKTFYRAFTKKHGISPAIWRKNKI